VNVDGFNEKESLAPLQIHSGSAESLRSDVGFRAFYQWQIGKIVVAPSLKAAWEHEYKYSALPITVGFAGTADSKLSFPGRSLQSSATTPKRTLKRSVSRLLPAAHISHNFKARHARKLE
jgi:uncharacterized protein with beta-barrel porin domain